jgi:hypothetical protein
MLTWSWIIQITIISIILIFLVHHLINFFKGVLTVPKIKDLVNTQNEKYKNIYDTISNKNNYNDLRTDNESNISKINYTLEDILPPNVNTSVISNSKNNNMKNELRNFIKTQLVSDPDSNVYN